MANEIDFSVDAEKECCTRKKEDPWQRAAEAHGESGGSQMKVVVADRHALVRAGLRLLLQDMQLGCVVAETGDGLDAMSMLRQHNPDVVIADLDLESMAGLDIIDAINRQHKTTRIIILTSSQSELNVAKALDAGAHAYVLKHSCAHTLAFAMRAVRCGKKEYLDPKLDAVRVAQLRSPSGKYREICANRRLNGSSVSVTLREQQVLKLIAEGTNNRKIGQLLSISEKTVETHRLTVMQKFGAHNTAELVRCALRLGVTSL